MINVDEIILKIKDLEPAKLLEYLSSNYKGEVTFSSSLGWEDQVITHHIFAYQLPIEVFTLDTGRLFNETYSVLSSTLNRYKQQIKVYSPKAELLEPMLTQKGPMSFYKSIVNRKECCFIRKVEPLKRALAGKKIWITGLRAEQSDNRKDMPIAEWDEGNQIIKVHPLINWTLDDVKQEIKKHNIPYNVLHDKGFVSIGCAPCTRSVKEGEDFRAGRWWWENKSNKECGLHS